MNACFRRFPLKDWSFIGKNIWNIYHVLVNYSNSSVESEEPDRKRIIYCWINKWLYNYLVSYYKDFYVLRKMVSRPYRCHLGINLWYFKFLRQGKLFKIENAELHNFIIAERQFFLLPKVSEMRRLLDFYLYIFVRDKRNFTLFWSDFYFLMLQSYIHAMKNKTLLNKSIS